MYFDLSKPQKLLQQSVRDVCRRHFSMDRVRQITESEAGFDDTLWGEIADQGWLGLHLDESVDGLGLGLIELAIVAEEFGRACVPSPWFATNWAGTILAQCEHNPSKEFVRKLVAGEQLASVAAWEPQVSWHLHPQYLETELFDQWDAHGKRHTLCGRKLMVMFPLVADQLVTVAKYKNEMCLVMVPRGARGVTIDSSDAMDRTSRLGQCHFDHVEIESDQVIAMGNQARTVWQSSQQIMLVAAAADMLGAMQWMLETTVEYAKTRKQFDQPIGKFQAVQHKCADMLLMTESARSAVWYAAWASQQHQPDADRACSIAKAYLSDAAQRVGNLAIQVHGGIGFTWEHDLHLYYKRVRANEYLLGDATFHRNQIADSILEN